MINQGNMNANHLLSASEAKEVAKAHDIFTGNDSLPADYIQECMARDSAKRFLKDSEIPATARNPDFKNISDKDWNLD